MKNKALLLILTLSVGLLLTSVIFLAIGSAQAAATATARYVAGDGICGGHAPCYSTPQAAVDAASAGDTILVAEGAYTGVGTRTAIPRSCTSTRR